MALHPDPQQSETAAPIGDATTNRRPGSVVQVQIEPRALLYLNLHTGELLEIPKAEVTSFENECRRMSAIAQQHLAANEELAIAYESWSRVVARAMPLPQEKARAEAVLAEARAKQEAAHQALRQEIEPLGKLNERDVRLMELIPLMTRTHGGMQVKGADGQTLKRVAGFKTTYVRSDKVKSHWRSYKLSKADIQSGHESILKKGPDGKTKIDADKLLNQINEAKVKASWLKSILDEDAMPEVKGTLTEWATAWNRDLNWISEVNFGQRDNNVTLSAQAQLMRYFAGVGGDAEWEPHKGRVSLKAEGRAEFAVAEGTAGCELCLPSNAGLQLYMKDLNGKRHDIGPMRFKTHLKLFGGVGASIVGELALSADYKEGKKQEWGIRGTPRSGKRKSHLDELDVGSTSRDSAVGAELEVFAGAQGDISFKGSLQWLHPEETKGKFNAFASLAPAVGGQLGAGIGGQLELSYVNGTFRFRAKASVCLGLGAKGRLELEVEAKHIWSFVKWFFYALYNVNYNNLTFVSRKTFEAINQLYFIAVLQKKDLGQVIKEMVSDQIIAVHFMEILKKFAREETRIRLMNNILDNPKLLLYSPPETRGMLLYQLTRHSEVSKADLRNWESFEVMGRRKRAAITVIKTIQTVRDYENTLQHMRPDGEKGAAWQESEAHILRFLEIGLGNSSYDEELMDYVQRLRTKTFVAQLHMEPTRGYAVVHNDSMQYFARAGDHPLFASAGAIDAASVQPLIVKKPMA